MLQKRDFLTLLYEPCSDYQIEAPISAESVILSVSKATVSPPPKSHLEFLRSYLLELRGSADEVHDLEVRGFAPCQFGSVGIGISEQDLDGFY